MMTEADEKLHEVRLLVQEAIDTLAEIEVKRCPGHDEYKPAFKAAISRAFLGLLKVREDLGS